MISAVLMALPEFKPIKSEQEFAQYSMLSFNTLAKLCFIATLRINPSVAHDDLGIEMDDTEIKNNRCIIDADTGSNVSPDSASEVDTSEQIENASLVFTLEELEPVYRFLDSRRYSVLEAQVGNELKNCIVLSSKRTRIITEAILMHRSNYEDVYKSLKGYDIPAPSTGQDDLTTDSIRTYKLAAVIKKMTDDELEKLYTSVIENSTKHKDIDIPDDVYKITSHSLLENIEKGVDDSTVYTKVNEMLGKMLADTTEDGHSTAEYDKDNKSEAEDDIDFDPWDTDTDFAVTCDTNSTTSNGQAMSNRQHYLTLLDGMDISQFINDSFSSKNPEDMNDCELEKLCNMVIEHMESSGECTVIHYNPGGKDNSYTSISALTAPTSIKDSSKIKNSFVLYAHPEVNTDYDHLQDRCVIDSELEEESYGYGNFPKRMDDTRGFTWQCYDKFPKFTRISNRVSPHGLEEYINDWQALGLKPQIAQAAVAWIRKTLLDAIGKVDQRNLEIIPTDIQTMAIRHLLKHRNDILIASNAASGKTLAYLLPIIQKLKKHETLKLRHPNAPRALVLVPNRELADQILHVVKGLGHVVKISSEIISGGVYKGIQRDDMKRLVDVVVATPDRLLKMKNHVKLHQLQYLVLDEADTLLNEGFWPDVAKVLDLIKQPFQLIQVAASSKYLLHFEKVQRELAKVPNLKGIKNTTREVNDKYLDRLTKCEQIVDTAWVDRPNRGVTHQFHYLKGEDKGLELVNLLKYDDVRRCRKVMVFCNSVSSCRAVEYILRDAGLPATSLHGKIPIMQRRMYYKEFLRSSEGIIVCTDLASRGLDLNADAVIMFDFPLNSMDYLKRAGRVGRMINNDSIAPKGFAISLVKKRDRNLAIAIERSLKMPFFPISNLSRHKKDYNQRSGRLKYLTQAGGYFKLAKLLRQEEIKGTYNYANMGQYLEQFKEIVKEMYARSLKKIVLRRRRICKRRRILTRRLKLMKRYNKAIRLKQRIISMTDRRRRRKKFSMHSPMKGDDRRCPPIKDLKPIRAKILELKLMQDKLTRRLLERNDKYLRKFINKTQLTALALRKSPENEEEVVDRQLPFTIIQKAKDKVGKSIKRICSLI
uniref:RNA helicase family protein n=2 Tax=Babesia bovis TaxID=5865 RepID=A7AM30_BABBO|eukprot:XP_001611182.1 RNA helicase family protein [Babesia bovis T2Bo]